MAGDKGRNATTKTTKMPSRRYHSKSRHGCGTCKQSKVRCDLNRPACKRCVRLERPCSFVNDDASSGASTSTSGYRSVILPVATSHVMLPRPASQDLELMHFFDIATSYTMTDIAETLPIWQNEIPKLAFQHEFLLHGILALSALHLSQTQDRAPKHREIARKHQSVALSAYIPLLRDINESNSNALFAFSAILGATSFAFLQDEQSSSYEFVKDFVDVFELLVGSTIVAVEGRKWLKHGELAALLVANPFLDCDTCSRDINAKASLDTILNCLRNLGEPNDDAHMYATSIEQLGSLFPASTASMLPMSKVIGWPALTGNMLINKLKRRDPVAMVILAHYGVGLHLNEHIWFLEGLGDKLIRSVAELLDNEWRPYIEWPLAMISS